MQQSADKPLGERVALLELAKGYLEDNHNKLDAKLEKLDKDLTTEREARIKFTERYAGISIGVMLFSGFVGWLISQWNALSGGKPPPGVH